MNKTSLRQFLMDNPEICHIILSGAISFHGSDMDMGRLLSSFNQSGYKVTVEVDDDDLTEEERKKRDADLADKAIRVLMTQRGRRI